MLEIKKGAGYGKSCPKVEKFFEEFPTIVICGQAYPPVRTKSKWTNRWKADFMQGLPFRKVKDFTDNHLFRQCKNSIATIECMYDTTVWLNGTNESNRCNAFFSLHIILIATLLGRLWHCPSPCASNMKIVTYSFLRITANFVEISALSLHFHRSDQAHNRKLLTTYLKWWGLEVLRKFQPS